MGEKITETIVVDPERGLVLDRDTKSRGVEAVVVIENNELKRRIRRGLADMQKRGKLPFTF